MEINFSVDLTVKDMYRFLLYNTYYKFTGILWIVFSFVVVGITIYTWETVPLMNSMLMIALAMLYTIINPILIYIKARKQIKRNHQILSDLQYKINDQGIYIFQGEEEAHCEWNQIWKIVQYKNQVVAYVSTSRAFIFPMDSIKEQYNELVEIANKNMTSRNHLKKRSFS